LTDVAYAEIVRNGIGTLAQSLVYDGSSHRPSQFAGNPYPVEPATLRTLSSIPDGKLNWRNQ
jgi:hypothetical protein